MNHIGNHLRKIRKDWGKTLRELSDYSDLSIDYLSKVEKGDRVPSDQLLKSISKFYSIPYDELKELKVSDEILKLLDSIDDKKKVLKLVQKRRKNPNHGIHITNSNPFKKEKVKKKYVKGGKYGKVKGLNYYIQSNGKLKKKDRESLLRLSEDYMTLILGTELDSSLSDIELIEEWNQFFDQHGMRFPEFEERWFRENPIPDEIQKEPSNSENKKIELPDFLKQKMKDGNRSNLG